MFHAYGGKHFLIINKYNSKYNSKNYHQHKNRVFVRNIYLNYSVVLFIKGGGCGYFIIIFFHLEKMIKFTRKNKRAQAFYQFLQKAKFATYGFK